MTVFLSKVSMSGSSAAGDVRVLCFAFWCGSQVSGVVVCGSECVVVFLLVGARMATRA